MEPTHSSGMEPLHSIPLRSRTEHTLSDPHCTSSVGSGLNYSPGRRAAASGGGEHDGAPEQEGLDNGGSGQMEVKKRKMISSIPCAAAWFLQGAGQQDEDVNAELPDTATWSARSAAARWSSPSNLATDTTYQPRPSAVTMDIHACASS
jgi:hypothetical protein